MYIKNIFKIIVKTKKKIKITLKNKLFIK